ncbi:MAG: PqqD family protein [Bryobacteraceae bacterium]
MPETTKRYVARSREIAARTLGDETMIMSAKESSLFTLNGTATAIWNAADGVTPLGEIIDRHVCEEFDVSRDEALRDAEELVAELEKRGLLIVSEAPMPEAK